MSQQVDYLIQTLLTEMPQHKDQEKKFNQSNEKRRLFLRQLMNVRPPMPLSPEFLAVQDALLTEETTARGIVDSNELIPCKNHQQIVLWQGDITRLQVDAIVNAANSGLLGCFMPGHNCIDNVIHSASGLQLREECYELMEKQGHEEPTGKAKITKGYNLPSRFVLHTVGPIIYGKLTDEDCKLLADCYTSCLTLAVESGLQTIAFPCISTGVFRFPNKEAAKVAIETVRGFLATQGSDIKVIFNVFLDKDLQIYREILED